MPTPRIDAFIIDKIERRRIEELERIDRRPHAPGPGIGPNDWRRYPENRQPEDLIPGKDPDDNGDGSVNIPKDNLDEVVWRMSHNLKAVFH